VCLCVCDTDTVIKQQLSSLSYVRTVCNTRQQQLSDGVADSNGVLPGVRAHSLTVLSLLVRLRQRYSGSEIYAIYAEDSIVE